MDLKNGMDIINQFRSSKAREHANKLIRTIRYFTGATGLVKLQFIKTELLTADSLTKSLGNPLYDRHIHNLHNGFNGKLPIEEKDIVMCVDVQFWINLEGESIWFNQIDDVLESNII